MTRSRRDRSMLGLGFAVAMLLIVSSAAAQSLRGPPLANQRPFDAPLLPGVLELPELPPEYLVQNDEGMTFAYHPSARERVRPIIEDAGVLRQQLRSFLGIPVLSSVEVRIAINATDVQRILPRYHSATPGKPTALARGLATPSITFSQLNLVFLNLSVTAEERELDASAAFRHAIAHLALDEATAQHDLPLFLHEGFAITISRNARLSRANAVFWLAVKQRMVTVAELDWHLPQPLNDNSAYAAQAADFTKFLLVNDRQRFAGFVGRVRAGQPWPAALEEAYEAKLSGIEANWRRDLAKSRVFLPVLVGAAALWVCMTLVLVIVRRLRARQSAQRERRGVARTSRATLHLRVADVSDEKRLPSNYPPPPSDAADGDVPKIAHEGQWHTLH